MAKAPSKTNKPTPAAKPKKAVAELAKTKAQPAATKAKAAPKPKTSAKPKTKSEPGVIKQTTDAISQLASDILADRIVPTIEQIKSIAASALGQDQTKGKRAKKKK